MDEWQARQILEFLWRNPDACDAVERKIMAISSPCGAPIETPDPEPTEESAFLNAEDELRSDLCEFPITSKTRVCRHLTRLDLQDCMQCADEESRLAEEFPVGTLRDGMRGFRGGKT